MSKTILVTGSNGLLGQKLTDLLSGKVLPYHLLASSRGPDRYPSQRGYQYIDLDITNPVRVAEVVNTYRPDYIINTAAMTNVDACEADQAGCTRLNVDAVSTLVDLCEKHGSHLIHLSTDFVFDGKNGPYREEDPIAPLSHYGQSKADAEKLIMESECKWTILRTILVYGVVADMSRSNIVLWAKSTLEKGQTISAVHDQWRMPTLAEDLAMACLLAIDKNQNGLFHISGSSMFSIYELVGEIADFWGLDKSLINAISSETLAQAAPRPARTGFVLDKARSLLGYEPTSFRDGLALVDRQLRQ